VEIRTGSHLASAAAFPGGTHAAGIGEACRQAMLWLFARGGR